MMTTSNPVLAAIQGFDRATAEQAEALATFEDVTAAAVEARARVAELQAQGNRAFAAAHRGYTCEPIPVKDLMAEARAVAALEAAGRDAAAVLKARERATAAARCEIPRAMQAAGLRSVAVGHRVFIDETPPAPLRQLGTPGRLIPASGGYGPIWIEPEPAPAPPEPAWMVVIVAAAALD